MYNWNTKLKFENPLFSFVEHKIPLRLCQLCSLNRSTVRPFGSLPRPHYFTFSVNNSFSMKKLEKNFMTVTPFYFQFYIWVQSFIRIERLKTFFFCLYNPLNSSPTSYYFILLHGVVRDGTAKKNFFYHRVNGCVIILM